MTIVTPTTIGPFVAGEIPEPLAVTFNDSSGSGLAITGWTAKFVITAQDGTVTTRNATISGSVATYVWVADDMDTAGWYLGTMWVGNGANRYASEQYEWTIVDQGTAPAI